MMRHVLTAISLAGLLLLGTTEAGPLAPDQVPEPLRAWTDWVLWSDPAHACPRLNGDDRTRACVWPGRLRLALDDTGGTFDLQVRTFGEVAVPLPGDGDHWPLAVQAQGQAAPVVSQEGRPQVWLPPGDHSLNGRFIWDALPAALSLPPQVALLEMSLAGSTVEFPPWNDRGQVWLSEQGPALAVTEAPEDSLRLQVFRRLEEGVPMMLTTRMVLDVAGNPRDITLPSPLPPGTLPLVIDSPLAARLEPDGHLRLQARPGQWVLRIGARYLEDRTSFPFTPLPEPWPRQEIWTYQANSAIRLTEVQGAPAVDPRQTELPADWQSLPAYRLQEGTRLELHVIRRGDPSPEPDRLKLQRRLWLDFDGQGLSVRDRITGTMTQGWRLSAGQGMSLGRVDIDGEPQSITEDPLTGSLGVEVRRGQLNLSADSRLLTSRPLSATGWDQDFSEVGAELNLPPGWRLVSASGVDQAQGAWLASWTLLDFFLVLVITLAIGRLFGAKTAMLALIALVLTWQEPEAPRYVWLNLLVAVALERVLAGHSLARWVRGYRLIALLALALIAIPFMASQLRHGLYPQLENPWLAQRSQDQGPREDATSALAPLGMVAREELAGVPSLPARLKAPESKGESNAPAPRSDLNQIDPDALTQTGPGLPQWQWHRVALTWQGPVQLSQELRLVLLPPAANLLLAFLQVILTLGLAFLLVGGPGKVTHGWQRLGAALMLVSLALGTASASAADLPSPALLEELKARLQAPPACHPHCAEINHLALSVSPGELALELEIDVQEQVGVPLPAQVGQWLPSRVLVEGQPATALLRGSEGYPWLLLAPGRRHISLAGPLPARERIALPLPLKPRRVTAEGQGWTLLGIGANGVPEVQLQLLREAAAPAGGQTELPGEAPQAGTSAGATEPGPPARALPPFLELERTLVLGLSWRVETRLRRLTPDQEPLRLQIPLLPGEAVLTAGLKVQEGLITANLPAGQGELTWESRLEPQEVLILTAPLTSLWTEVWRLDVSPIWHLDPAGLAPIHHQGPAGNWRPEWRPWPGERLSLSIRRPAAAPGASLTLDSSEYRLRPGDQATEASLKLRVRASRGTRQSVVLPPGAELQSVTLDGRAQPIRLEEGRVLLPIHPGSQEAVLAWRQDGGIANHWRVPAIDLGLASVNASTLIELGQDRWVLWLGGPSLGPAVLFWSLIPLIVLLALGLARLRWSPLRAWQWGLLLLGLSQAPPLGAVIVVGWLLTLAWRGAKGRDLSPGAFNLLQIGLVLLSLQAMSALAGAVAEGLLGQPAMQIAGNGSHATLLNWYQDRSDATLPQPWVISLPLWVYRALMLAWALWLANSLLNWLKWGWGCFSADGLWRQRPPSPPPGTWGDGKGGDAASRSGEGASVA